MLFAVVSITFFSCKEAPRDFNSNLLGPDQINLITLDSFVANLSQSSNSFKTVVPLGSSYELLLGSYTSNSNNEQNASTLIQFDYSTISDSDKTNLLNGSISVIDSWIIFTKTYAFGDTSATQIDFGAYKINTPWTSAGFTSDSLNNFSYNTNDLSGQKNFANDSTNVYYIHIAGGTIQNQIANYANGVQDYGLYLKPNTSDNTVWGFGAINSSYPPALAVVVNRGAALADTLYFNTLSDVSVLAGDLESSNSDIYVQPSLIGESKLWFNVSLIPSDAIINQAKLKLTIDPSNTVNGTAYNSDLYIYNLSDSTAKTIDSTLAPTSITSLDSTTYEGDITTIVQKWVTNKKNQGMLLTPQGFFTGLDIFAFKGSNSPNVQQRPRLVILYTTRK